MKADLEQALTALKSGDVEGGLRLLERTVLSFGMKVCGHREDAEDTAQEVLLKLLPYITRFDNPSAFAVWLYTVARNRCLMSRRRSKFAPREHLRLEDLMPDGQELAALASPKEATPESLLLRAEHSEHVRSALQNIPAQYRLVLVLHDMEGLGTAEIAKIMAIREGTVRVRLHRARLALRQELSSRERSVSHLKKQPVQKPRQCREIFAALSDYLDQTLDPGMCDKLEKHLDGCQPCEAFLADLERTVERCRAYDAGCKSKQTSKFRDRVLQDYKRVLSSIQKKAAAR
ncbi:MAG TPA: sigma-70 family RNA polymerase sigma factor [Clostridia bacterium]|nr:sigma-70 family RNA polymerase sigma factor [Clostridia bacterium]